jgi:hypothetical protein
MRGHRGAKLEINRIVISTRQYEFNPPAWQLLDETLQKCADDTPDPFIPRDQSHPVQVEPCWPSKSEPVLPESGADPPP